MKNKMTMMKTKRISITQEEVLYRLKKRSLGINGGGDETENL